MFYPEIEEGNIEYKRYFKDLNRERFYELVSQMNWRLNEGNGIAYYYLGINDDGTVYNKLTSHNIKYSFEQIKLMAIECNSTVSNIENHKNWFKIEIKTNKSLKAYKEYRILLLGDSNSGKTTFLSYIVKKKLDTNKNKARNYIFNHKHELETGNTSSINYQYVIDNDNKYIFMDTPGLEIYNKTQIKLVLSLNYNLILYFTNFNNKKWEFEDLFFKYFEMNNIPIVKLHLCNSINNYPKINMKNPYTTNQILQYFKKDLKKIFVLDVDTTYFVVLNTIYLVDIGWLISGYLKSGKLKINDKLYWYTEGIDQIKVKTIHDSKLDSPVSESSAYATITIGCDLDKNNIKYGFISNKNFKIIKEFRLKNVYKNAEIPNQMILYIENIKISICNKKNNLWYIESSNIKVRENIYRKHCIGLSKDFMGIFCIVEKV
uniref:Tr-type G domain-containing protein n=1 Tax=Megaviridae environmental sample TaxID=1737588 RepID=A0A5J6VKG3_9VIRU|nr:MAG: hypothetical protein [Megaviridae environmental sample]